MASARVNPRLTLFRPKVRKRSLQVLKFLKKIAAWTMFKEFSLRFRISWRSMGLKSSTPSMPFSWLDTSPTSSTPWLTSLAVNRPFDYAGWLCLEYSLLLFILWRRGGGMSFMKGSSTLPHNLWSVTSKSSNCESLVIIPLSYFISYLYLHCIDIHQKQYFNYSSYGKMHVNGLDFMLINDCKSFRANGWVCPSLNC